MKREELEGYKHEYSQGYFPDWMFMRMYQELQKTVPPEIEPPKGYTKIQDVSAVFVSDDDEIVVLGTPESTNEENGHNCDYMGCSSMEHVIFRGKMKDVRVGW